MHLAAEKLTVCRQRVQQETLGHRGRSGDPLYGIKRVLLTRKVLRTDKQKARLEAVFADEQHIDVEVAEHIYQDLVAAYATPDKRAGKLTMFKTLKRIKPGVPKELAELAQLGRSLWKRRQEILAYFDTGRLERSGRGDQRSPRVSARYRVRFPQSRAAVSSTQRNTADEFVQFLTRGMEFVNLPGAVVELLDHCLDRVVGDVVEVSALRIVVAD